MKTPAALLTLALTLTLGSCSATEQMPSSEEPPVEELADEAEATSEPDRRMPEAAAVFDTPWPTDFARAELSDTALAKFNAYVDERVDTKPSVALTMVLQDTIDPWHEGWTTDLARLSVATFSDYPVPDPLFILGTDQQFMIQELVVRGRETHPVGGVCGYEGEIPQGCAYNGVVWKGLELGPAGSPTGPGYIPHEYFHLVQDNLDPGPGGQTLPPGHPFYRPVWLIEGSAEFVGPALVNYAGLGAYGDNYPWFGSYAPVEDSGILANFEKYESSYGPYDYGRLATEYIVANAGVDAFLNIFVYLGEGDSFETAFERAVGLSVADFYAAYDSVIANLAEDGIALR